MFSLSTLLKVNMYSCSICICLSTYVVLMYLQHVYMKYVYLDKDFEICVCVHIDNNYIIMCVSIDSRCVLGYLNKQVKPLSYDHKPLNKEEKKRIEGAGGYVQWNRVGEYILYI